jgi:hypothetical protein
MNLGHAIANHGGQSVSKAPSRGRVVAAGLLAGLSVNVVDIPNSAILVSPGWSRFLAEHQIVMNVPFVSAFYTSLHFVYGIALMAFYEVFAARYGRGLRVALAATAAVLAIHRFFGLGMVVMGTMPLGIYLQFSASMIAGSLLGGALGARILDRGAR